MNQGALAALASAVLFGATAPIAKRLLADAQPLMLAALLYLGAGVGLTLLRLFAWREPARLSRADFGVMALIVLSGGVLGPALLLFGLSRLSGVAGSMLLNFEALSTVMLAALFFHEHVGRRVLAATAAILVGGALLAYRPGELRGDLSGVLAVVGACAAWGLDNNLTRKLSLKNPIAIVQLKTLAAGACNLALAFAVGERFPAGALPAAATVGFLGYGVSIVLDVVALRLLGAAREAAFFATAPFIGAALAVPLLGERLRTSDLLAAAAMAIGVVILVRERHSHLHTHEAMEHEHRHVHDEHHQHAHEPGQDASAPHSHRHRHDAITHEHGHAPDEHHRHRH